MLLSSTRCLRNFSFTCWYFTDGGRVKTVVIVAIAGLDKDGRVGQTVGKDLAIDVAKLNTFSNVSSRIFDCRISVHV